jgi:hypothetical protein
VLRFEDGLVFLELAFDTRYHFLDPLLVSSPIAGGQASHPATRRIRLENPK